MHVAIALALAVLAVLVLVGLMGASPFIGIPILAFAVVFAAIYAVVARRLAERSLDTDAPSTREASYTPVSDPTETER
jgi:Na+/H+ antiporter NhaD/arsenite permease-like protein